MQQSRANMKPENYRSVHLEQLFNKAKPKSRYISESHIQDETNSITKEIINGDIEIAKERQNINSSIQRSDYEEVMKKKFLEQIQREKAKLEQKLGYIENSIQSVNKFDFLKKRQSNSLNKSNSQQNLAENKEDWRKQYKENLKKIEQKKKLIKQKQKERQVEMEELQQKIKQQQDSKKRAEIMQNMKKIKSRMEQRQANIKIENQRLKELMHKKQLYQKIEDNYKDKQQSMLEERKKKLAQIRKLSSPINAQQLLQHERSFLELKKQKQELRQRQKRMNQSRAASYKPSYQSSFYKKIAENNEQAQDLNSSRAKIQKMKQFAMHVKNKFAPEIDERKRRQMEEQLEKQQQNERLKAQKQKELLQRSKLKGLEYLDLIKKLPKKKQNPLADQSPKTQRIQYKNYLGINKSTDMARKPWQTLLNSKGQKVQTALLMQIQSEKIEQRLKRKEEKSKILKIKDDGSIDQEYYEMVKAKLNLLSKE